MLQGPDDSSALLYLQCELATSTHSTKHASEQPFLSPAAPLLILSSHQPKGAPATYPPPVPETLWSLANGSFQSCSLSPITLPALVITPPLGYLPPLCKLSKSPSEFFFFKKQKECDSMIPLLKSLVWLSIACKVNSSLSGTLPHSLSLTSLSISNEKNFHNSESLDVRFLPSRISFHLFSSGKLMFIPRSLAQLLAPLWSLSQIPVFHCNSTCHIWVTCLHVWLHKIELLNVDCLSYFCVTLFPTQTNGATDNHVTHLTISSFPPM